MTTETVTWGGERIDKERTRCLAILCKTNDVRVAYHAIDSGADPDTVPSIESDMQDWRTLAEECLWRLDQVGWKVEPSIPRVKPERDTVPPKPT